jgi:predicted lipoprotein
VSIGAGAARYLAIAAMLFSCGGTGVAAPPPGAVAAPFYTPEQFMQGVHRGWTAPRAEEFATAAAALRSALTAWCATGSPPAPPDITLRDGARAQWRATMVAWTRLSSVAVGPVLERRSARLVDFAPTRPALIERAIAAAPADAPAMERVGAPAKGLPALEWLLWTRPAVPRSPSCAYMVAIAADLEREAVALNLAFAALAQREWNADAAVPAMAEVLNQWIGAVERLRWAAMEKPMRAAGSKPPDFPRRASGATAAQWAAQWDAINAFAVITQPGGTLIPLEAYLRGRGLNPAADALAKATRQARDRMVQGAPASPARVEGAARALANLKRVVETRAAPPLKINIGFSDADGD